MFSFYTVEWGHAKDKDLVLRLFPRNPQKWKWYLSLTPVQMYKLKHLWQMALQSLSQFLHHLTVLQLLLLRWAFQHLVEIWPPVLQSAMKENHDLLLFHLFWYLYSTVRISPQPSQEKTSSFPSAFLQKT